MIVTFPPDVEKKIIALATQKSVDPAFLVTSLVEKQLSDELAHDLVHDNDYEPEALHRAVAALVNRTQSQIKTAQERAIKEFKPARDLPPDVSPLEVLPIIRGDETDEQVFQALNELS